ncbi:Delta(8)-fatty-acid desaturase [Escovopsis weberi]|uniref:Delta 8-(E)-sphingolipid desaturase n=1 Tax=Escovopsis weberi TaxID=150374 RepID=A0A0M9VT21_ESCWE|nr:Delta(8)-fatty-acid desaturase [Escovopsis weberi]
MSRGSADAGTQQSSQHAASAARAQADDDGLANLSVMTRGEIEAMIADGRKLMIFRQQVLKVDSWLPYHPGGQKALLHMVGRDATDEIVALHSQEAQQQMLRYRIGKIEGPWTNFIPPIQGGIFRALAEIPQDSEDPDSDTTSLDMSSSIFTTMSSATSLDEDQNDIQSRPEKTAPPPTSSASIAAQDLDGMSYLDAITHEKIELDLEKYPAVDASTQAQIVSEFRELRQRLDAAGLFKTHYSNYAIECCRYVSLFVMAIVWVRCGWYALGGALIGFMWHQLVFTAHDAGHMGITHGYHTDTLIGIFIADFIGGLSMCWWKENHNVHHIVTNQPEHDPDIEHMPIFAVSHRLLGSLRSTYYDRVMEYDAFAKVLLRIQPWTYYPFLAFGRFNLYVLSWEYVIKGRGPRKGPAAWHRWMEVAGQIFFWIWFGYGIVYRMIPDNWSRFVFVMVSHMAASPLHVQIVLSHFAMSTTDLGPQESFAQKQLRTTMDVDCPTWLDFLHGGLQFQAIHHLFPRMPRHNLRQAQPFVREFCAKVGIPYAYYGFARGNKEVIGRLAEVSRQAAILSKCKQSIVESGNPFGHH